MNNSIYKKYFNPSSLILPTSFAKTPLAPDSIYSGRTSGTATPVSTVFLNNQAIPPAFTEASYFLDDYFRYSHASDNGSQLDPRSFFCFLFTALEDWVSSVFSSPDFCTFTLNKEKERASLSFSASSLLSLLFGSFVVVTAECLGCFDTRTRTEKMLVWGIPRLAVSLTDKAYRTSLHSRFLAEQHSDVPSRVIQDPYSLISTHPIHKDEYKEEDKKEEREITVELNAMKVTENELNTSCVEEGGTEALAPLYSSKWSKVEMLRKMRSVLYSPDLLSGEECPDNKRHTNLLHECPAFFPMTSFSFFCDDPYDTDVEDINHNSSDTGNLPYSRRKVPCECTTTFFDPSYGTESRQCIRSTYTSDTRVMLGRISRCQRTSRDEASESAVLCLQKFLLWM